MLKSPQPALRLAPISYIPALDDLISQAKTAQRNTNRNVELPWQTAGVDKQYVLTCCFASHRDLVSRRDKAEISGIVWSLSYTSHITLKATTVWQYTSEDVELIQKLCNAEVDGRPIQYVFAEGTAMTPGTGPVPAAGATPAGGTMQGSGPDGTAAGGVGANGTPGSAPPSEMSQFQNLIAGGFAHMVSDKPQQWDSGTFSDATQQRAALQSGTYAAQSPQAQSSITTQTGLQPPQFNSGSQTQFNSGQQPNVVPPGTQFPSGSYPQFNLQTVQTGNFPQVAAAHVANANAQPTMQLAGSIQQVQIMDVLQSINVCRMTGRLDIDDVGNRTTLYFHAGEPVHALSENTLAFETSSQQGTDAILDVLTWETGMFRFQPDLTTRDHTITRKLASILLEGATLADYTHELSEDGVTLESVLIRSDSVKSWEEVQAQLKTGLPLDQQQQIKFCMAFDGKKSVRDVVKDLDLAKPVWLPMVFNLLKVNLLKLSTKSARSQAKTYNIDNNVIELAHANLLRPETGMLSFPMFLYFLVKEFARFRMERYPISLIVFGITCTRKNGQMEPLTNDCFKAIAAHLKATCNELDTFGHFETTDFALLLPYKKLDEAKEFATTLAENLPNVLPKHFLQQGLTLHLSFGLASAPQDGDTPEVIVGLAKSFKDQSQAKGGGMIVCASEN